MSIPAWLIALLIALFGTFGTVGGKHQVSAKQTTTSATMSTEETATCTISENIAVCDVVTTNTGN